MATKDSETTQRLEAAATQCLSAWGAWCADKKQSAARGALVDALHELRRVASRLEIEMAVSEREDMAMRPIPIPSHRDARREGGQQQEAQGYTYDLNALEQDGTEDEEGVQPNTSESGRSGGGDAGAARRRAPFRRRPNPTGGNAGNR